MSIICDSREPETIKAVFRAKLGEEKIEHEWQKLPCGDFLVSRADGVRILVERKTWADLGASLADGRLFNQLQRCLDWRQGPEYWSVLLIEADPLAATYNPVTRQVNPVGRGPAVHPNATRGALLELQRRGVYVVHSEGKVDTVTALIWMHNSRVFLRAQEREDET